MLVCLCKGVSDRDIHSLMDEGKTSFRQVRNELGVATSCGQCACYTKELIENRLAQDNDNSPQDLSYAAVI